MWIATKDGFYSAVQHRGHSEILVIRGRSKADIESLVGKITEGQDYIDVACLDDNTQQEIATVVQSPPGSDYPYRSFLYKSDWVEYLGMATTEVDYHNFKDKIHDVNAARADTYMKVWTDLLHIQGETNSGTTAPTWLTRPFSWDEEMGV